MDLSRKLVEFQKNCSDDTTVDDFFEHCGIPKEDRMDFAFAAILKGVPRAKRDIRRFDMAWVQLKNLFEDDKNYYGSIPDTVEGILEKGEHYHLLQDQTLGSDLLGKKIKACDLFETSLNTPEWSLGSDGKFTNFSEGLIELDDGSMIFPRLFTFDVSGWLSEQSVEKLKEIADHAFTKWAHNLEDVTEENTLPKDHPHQNDKWIYEKKCPRSVRNMEQQKIFFDKFPGK